MATTSLISDDYSCSNSSSKVGLLIKIVFFPELYEKLLPKTLRKFRNESWSSSHFRLQIGLFKATSLIFDGFSCSDSSSKRYLLIKSAFS